MIESGANRGIEASMATMEMVSVGRTVVLAHAPGAILDSDWSSFLSRMQQRDYDGLLVWAPKAAPNSRQRRSVIQAWDGQLPQVGVLTDSTTVKGVISVLSALLDNRIRGFEPARLDTALDHIRTPAALQAEVTATVARLRTLVPADHDRAFFSDLREKHQASLQASARAWCANDSDSDDLLQETFELALLHAETLKRAENPRAWLKTLLRNQFASRWRRSAREKWLDLSQLEERIAAPIPESEPAWASITQDEVWAAAKKLDPSLRQVFELYERDALSYREIAERIGVPTNTVGSRMNRSRAKLREVLGKAR